MTYARCRGEIDARLFQLEMRPPFCYILSMEVIRDFDDHYDFSKLELIGEGSRRRCFKIPRQPWCVKFYRLPSEYLATTKRSVKCTLGMSRFLAWFNVNYHECIYHAWLRHRVPANLFAAFPEQLKLVRSRSRGWGVMENYIESEGGALPRRVIDEMKHTNDMALRKRLYDATAWLFEQLAEHAVCFYDPPNVIVQWVGDDEFRLRIVDFEPMGRAFVPGLSFIPPYVRTKVRRRCGRHLKRLRETLLTEEHCLI